MRRLLAGLAAVGVVATTALVTSAAAQAGTGCGIRWGSLDKATSGVPGAGYGGPLTNVRAGRHECYDRLVLDFQGPGASAARVGYVPAVAYQARDGSLALRGGAFLSIVLLTTTYDINTGTSTYTPANSNELVHVTGWQTFRQIADGGSFEGYTTIGLGVRARLPFRLFPLAGPGGQSRLVIDVAHHWNPAAATAQDLPAPTSTARQYSPLGDNQNATLVGIRAGTHPAYDRVVFDFRGPTSGLRYVVGYVNLGSIGWWLRVDLVHGAMRDLPGGYQGPWIVYPAMAQLKTIRIFDAYGWGTTVLLKLDRIAGFRVLRLASPDRIVVDVAH